MPATPTIGIANYCCIPCFFSFDKLFIFLCIGISDFGRVLCTTEGLYVRLSRTCSRKA